MPKLHSDGPDTLVVVSYYDGRPADDLIRLLDEIGRIPAGRPFALRVVVNRTQDRPLELPPRHAGTEVLYRENLGYNIGAWEYGWRTGPEYRYYVFLQDECSILRKDWIHNYVKKAAVKRTGLVGENLHFRMPWDAVGELFHGLKQKYGIDSEGLSLPFLLDFYGRHGIDMGPTAAHLQSLVWCARREVLEAIDGFIIGHTKAEAIAVEIGTSRKLEALGLRLVQASFFPFHFVLHPQWQVIVDESRSLSWTCQRLLRPFLPYRARQRVKSFLKLSKLDV